MQFLFQPFGFQLRFQLSLVSQTLFRTVVFCIAGAKVCTFFESANILESFLLKKCIFLIFHCRNDYIPIYIILRHDVSVSYILHREPRLATRTERIRAPPGITQRQKITRRSACSPPGKSRTSLFLHSLNRTFAPASDRGRGKTTRRPTTKYDSTCEHTTTRRY